MNRLSNRPNRRRPSVPVGPPRRLTLKCYSEWSLAGCFSKNMTFTLPGELLFICLDSGVGFFGQNQWSYIISMYMHLSGQTWQFQVKGFTVFFCVVVHYFTQCVLIVSIVFAHCTTPSCWLLTATESWLPMMLNIYSGISIKSCLHICIMNAWQIKSNITLVTRFNFTLRCCR